jgi:DNA-binding GntR family transcriptional regulator
MSDDFRKHDYAFLPVLHRHGRGGTVQRIQDAIRDAIVRLEMRPGATIDKNALCERLIVSRFPVSEALGRLAEEGFVVVLPQRGTMVSRIDVADCTYFLGWHLVRAIPRPGLAGLKATVFAYLQRRSAQAAEFFRMPTKHVVVLATEIEI